MKKTPSKKRAVTPRTRAADDTQHDAAVAIASLDVDRGLRERIERMARRVQRLQRELGEVWDDMRRLLDPGAVVALEEFHAVTPGGGDKAVDISREFFTSGEINVALWDTVMYSLTHVDAEKALAKKSTILAAWINLNNSAEFSKLTVSNPRAVLTRNKLWQARLDEILG